MAIQLEDLRAKQAVSAEFGPAAVNYLKRVVGGTQFGSPQRWGRDRLLLVERDPGRGVNREFVEFIRGFPGRESWIARSGRYTNSWHTTDDLINGMFIPDLKSGGINYRAGEVRVDLEVQYDRNNFPPVLEGATLSTYPISDEVYPRSNREEPITEVHYRRTVVDKRRGLVSDGIAFNPGKNSTEIVAALKSNPNLSATRREGLASYGTAFFLDYRAGQLAGVYLTDTIGGGSTPEAYHSIGEMFDVKGQPYAFVFGNQVDRYGDSRLVVHRILQESGHRAVCALDVPQRLDTTLVNELFRMPYSELGNIVTKLVPQ